MSKTYFVKMLRLVPPTLANTLGIAAEAPTFISPLIDRPHHCPVCAITYTPLVYQAGHEIQAQHYHRNRGGIYFSVLHRLYVSNWLAGRTGWMAFVEPVGTADIRADVSRAATVRVTAITAWCMHGLVVGEPQLARAHGRHAIDRASSAPTLRSETARCSTRSGTCPSRRLDLR
jgi:hypothetical protein